VQIVHPAPVRVTVIMERAPEESSGKSTKPSE
jgi:hypothetical protein